MINGLRLDLNGMNVPLLSYSKQKVSLYLLLLSTFLFPTYPV